MIIVRSRAQCQILSEKDSQMTVLTKQSVLSDNCKGKNLSPNMTEEDVSNAVQG